MAGSGPIKGEDGEHEEGSLPFQIHGHGPQYTPSQLHQQQHYITPLTWQPFPSDNPYNSPTANRQSHTSSPAQEPAIGARIRRANACESCRRGKVRCDVDLGDTKCKRCIKTGGECHMTRPHGKRTEKTDKKVAKLEQRMEALTQTVAATGNGVVDGSLAGLQEFPQHTHYLNSAHQPFSPQTPYASPAPTSRKRPLSKFQADAYPDGNPYNPQPTGAYCTKPQPNSDPLAQAASFVQHSMNRENPYQHGAVRSPPGLADIVERYMPNAAEASRAFHYFVKAMIPQMPIIAFPENVKPDFIRVTKPTLFLAILSVATSGGVQLQLSTELLRILGERIIVNNEVSLELMQALQILILWCWPASGKAVCYDQYCSMACTMAITLGMGTPTNDSQHWSTWSAKHPEISIEGIRAYLGCFILDNIMATGLRVSSITRKFESKSTSRIIAILGLSQNSSTLDRLLGQWARLHQEEDDNKQSFQANTPSLSMSCHTLSLRSYNPLAQLRLMLAQSHSEAAKDGTHELAARAGAFHSGVNNLHWIIDAFSKFSKDEVCALPIFCFTHVAHASFLLVTIEKAIESLDSKKLEAGLVEDLKCRSYSPCLEGVVSLLRDAAKHSPSRCVMSFLKLLTVLQDWMCQQSDWRKSGTPLEVLSQVATGGSVSNGEQKGAFDGSPSVQAWVEDVAKDRSTMALKDSDLGTALNLVLAEGDIDLDYYEGLPELLSRAT